MAKDSDEIEQPTDQPSARPRETRGERPTVRTIAAELGLSIATVSRVLNNRPDVRDESRKRILEYLRSVDYQPPVVPSDLNLIGLVDSFQRHDLNSYYMSALLAGAEEYLHRFGYNIVLIHFDQIESELNQYGQATILNKLKGVLWLEPMFDRSHLDIVQKHRLPCVVINNTSGDVGVDVIQSDNYHAALRAIEFLVAHGHRGIGFVGGWLHLANHRDRLQGYLDGIAAAGLPRRDDWIVQDIVSWDEHGGYEGTSRLLTASPRPSAILLCSDFLAAGAYSAVSARDVRIPNDLSIVSFDDFPLAPYMHPPLTTFRQPLRDMARHAAERLMNRLTDRSLQPKVESVPCPLISRGSADHFGR